MGYTAEDTEYTKKEEPKWKTQKRRKERMERNAGWMIYNTVRWR